MHALPKLRRWAIRVAAALASAFLAVACNTSPSKDLDGKLCDANKKCASGYVCDEPSNVCVRPTGAGACREGETVCGGQCVILKTDAKNCGGCGATCTAPLDGAPVCETSSCSFV